MRKLKLNGKRYRQKKLFIFFLSCHFLTSFANSHQSHPPFNPKEIFLINSDVKQRIPSHINMMLVWWSEMCQIFDKKVEFFVFYIFCLYFLILFSLLSVDIFIISHMIYFWTLMLLTTQHNTMSGLWKGFCFPLSSFFFSHTLFFQRITAKKELFNFFDLLKSKWSEWNCRKLWSKWRWMKW